MMIAAGVCVGAIVRIAGDANDFRGLEQTISEMVEMSSFVCQCVELSFKWFNRLSKLWLQLLEFQF